MASTSSNGPPQPDDANIFKIFLATDIHLGYGEKDPHRCNDSFKAFEEVFKLARENNADMVLLGGDLFHENKPSRRCIHFATDILRRYCMGDRPISFQVIGDPRPAFFPEPATQTIPQTTASSSTSNKQSAPSKRPVSRMWTSLSMTVCPPADGLQNEPSILSQMNSEREESHAINFCDPNLNISYPVFSIHGNHDDPIGRDMLCALDVLQASGLVNYFGKQRSLEHIDIYPILLRKGDTTLALYGLGAIRDERLHKLFLANRVTFYQPDDVQADALFNIFMIHQNRVARTGTSYIPQSFLPNFLDLVVWGHEHDPHSEPEHFEDRNFYVLQPGSTVATSLTEEEQGPKFVGMLSIFKKQFKFKRIELRSTRQFLFRHVQLSATDLKPGELNTTRKVQDFLMQEIDKLVERAADERNEEKSKFGECLRPGKPLIRLRVDYSGGFETFSAIKYPKSLEFGQQFLDRVANPHDILKFYRSRTGASDRKDRRLSLDDQDDEGGRPLIETDATSVEDFVNKILREDAKGLKLLPTSKMRDALSGFVQKEDTEALSEAIDKSLRLSQSYFRKRMDDRARHGTDEWERVLERYERDVLEAYEREANPNDTTFLSLAEREPSPPPESAENAERKPEEEADEDGGGTQALRATRTSSLQEDADLLSDEEAEPPPTAALARTSGSGPKSKSKPTPEPSTSSRNQKRTTLNAGADLGDWDLSAIEETQSSIASTSRNQSAATGKRRGGRGARGALDASGTATRRNVIPETDTELEASQVSERSGSVDLMDLDDNLPNSSSFARPQKIPNRTGSTVSTASSSGLGVPPALGRNATRGPAAVAGKKSATARDEPSVDLIDVPSDDEDDEQSTAPSKAKRSRARTTAAAPSSRRAQKQQAPNSSTFLEDSSSNVSAAGAASAASQSSRQGGGRNISILSFLQPQPGSRPPLTSTQKSSSSTRSSGKNTTAARGGARGSHRAPSSEDEINRFHLDEQ